jgi:hypothetical protein
MKSVRNANDDLSTVHYTMGGTWVDYNLMTTIPGCFSPVNQLSITAKPLGAPH